MVARPRTRGGDPVAMKRRRRCAPAVLLALALFWPARSLAQSPIQPTFTIRLHVWVVCTQPETSWALCGRWPLSELEILVKIAVARANLGFAPSGMVFAPEVHYVQDARLAAFSGLDFTSDGKSWKETQEYVDLTAPANVMLDAAHWIMTESLVGSNWSGFEDWAVWTRTDFTGGNLMHELGHYLGLDHTFSYDDGPGADHDGDKSRFRSEKVEDCTPPDPGTVEVGPNDDMDLWEWSDLIGPLPTNMKKGHEFCELGERTAEGFVPGAFVPADVGSPLPDFPADPRCYTTIGRASATRSAVRPPWANALTYNEPAFGPRVYQGVRHEAFCPSQRSIHRLSLDKMQNPNQRAFKDICKEPGDRDLDGICDDVDRCIGRPDGLKYSDLDGDGISAECDLCDFDPYSSELVDLDGDGRAGICDDDEDGDGCPDGRDKDDLDGLILLRHIVAGATCRDSPAPEYVSAGVDPDGDGLPSCDPAEDDSDNDGIVDRLDPCPLFKGSVCEIVRDCPMARDFPLDACGASPGGCGRLRLQIDDRINYPLILENILIAFDGTFVLRPTPGQTASELAVAIASRLAPAGVRIRLLDGNESVGEWTFDTDAFEPLDLTRRGALVSFTVPLDKSDRGRVALSQLPFLPPGYLPRDLDGDSVPDAIDNCICVPNPMQLDDDFDGVGNACSGDLDGDRDADSDDELLLLKCVGVFVYDGRNSETDVAPGRSCARSDLDEDGIVSLSDYVLFRAASVEAGPSAFWQGDWKGVCR